MNRLLVVGYCFLFAAHASAQLTPTERKGLDDALFLGNMNSGDLNYSRRPFNDRYRLPLVNLCLDRPLEAADALMSIHERAGVGGLATLLKLAGTEALGHGAGRNVTASRGPSDPALFKLPVAVRAPVETLVAALQDANLAIKGATSKLTPLEKRELIETLPLLANEEPSIKFGFTKRTTFSRDRVLDLLNKVDQKLIESASVQLARVAEAQIPALRQAAQATPQPFHDKLRIDGLIVDIAGMGDDVHTSTDAVLTIDLGGHNRYEGRSGAGVGYAALGIDLGSGVLFDGPDINAGAGVVGIGLQYVMGGNGDFRGRSICFGAGLGGVGAFMKEGGDDTYSALSLAEGFGEFGIGIMLDTSGNDRYDGAFNVQGAARTQGCGWLIDRRGDDIYRAGGLILNSPLFSAVHYSNAQGYASGYREDTGGVSGGVGLLTDLAGDDTYLGETYCQAASYWFSVGSLYDRSGNDTYSAYHYAQASAMHCCGAYLFDLAGDDSYTIKYGAGHAIGHDYGVAFLLDRWGNDVYAAQDTRPGTGNANGLGIFIDAAGDDRYLGTGGVGNASRGAVSLGVFADLGGSNKYADTLTGGFGVVTGALGVAWDSSGFSEATSGPPAPQPEAPLARPQPGSLARPSDEELEKIYRTSTQWGVGTAAKEVSGGVNQLIAIGMPAVEWMTDKHLTHADRLQLRTFVAVVSAVGQPARGLIASRISSPNSEEASNALRIVTDAGIREAGPYISDALKRDSIRRAAARAAGAAGSHEAIPALTGLTAGEDPIDALAALVALTQIADPSSFETGQKLLGSAELPIRKAAVALVAKFPDKALPFAKALMGGSDERRARNGVEILSILGDATSIEAIGQALNDSRAGVRVSALVALNGRVPQGFRAAVSALRADPDPRVRGVASRLEMGR